MSIKLRFKHETLIKDLQNYGIQHNNKLILKAAQTIKDLSIENHILTHNNTFLPICIGCPGKTQSGERTELCGYANGDFSTCIEQTKRLSELLQQESNQLNNKE